MGKKRLDMMRAVLLSSASDRASRSQVRQERREDGYAISDNQADSYMGWRKTN